MYYKGNQQSCCLTLTAVATLENRTPMTSRPIQNDPAIEKGNRPRTWADFRLRPPYVAEHVWTNQTCLNDNWETLRQLEDLFFLEECQAQCPTPYRLQTKRRATPLTLEQAVAWLISNDYQDAAREVVAKAKKTGPPPAADPQLPKKVPISEQTKEEPGVLPDGRTERSEPENGTPEGNSPPPGFKVSEAARIAGCNPGVISKAVDNGKLKGNGETGRARRIDASDLARWQLERSQETETSESEDAVKRKLEKAEREMRRNNI